MPRAAVSILFLQVVSTAEAMTLNPDPAKKLALKEHKTQVAMVTVALGGMRQRLQHLARTDRICSP